MSSLRNVQILLNAYVDHLDEVVERWREYIASRGNEASSAKLDKITREFRAKAELIVQPRAPAVPLYGSKKHKQVVFSDKVLDALREKTVPRSGLEQLQEPAAGIKQPLAERREPREVTEEIETVSGVSDSYNDEKSGLQTFCLSLLQEVMDRIIMDDPINTSSPYDNATLTQTHRKTEETKECDAVLRRLILQRDVHQPRVPLQTLTSGAVNQLGPSQTLSSLSKDDRRKSFKTKVQFNSIIFEPPAQISGTDSSTLKKSILKPISQNDRVFQARPRIKTNLCPNGQLRIARAFNGSALRKHGVTCKRSSSLQKPVSLPYRHVSMSTSNGVQIVTKSNPPKLNDDRFHTLLKKLPR